MATYANPAAQRSLANTDSAGVVVVNPFKFNFADTSYAPAALAADTLVQIGIVPAGCKLIPHLCRVSVPVLDSAGSPTGDYSIGSATTPTALKGSAASETAVVLSGEDFTADTSELGSRTVDVPVYITIINVSATAPVVGVIEADLAIRAFDGTIDSEVL